MIEGRDHPFYPARPASRAEPNRARWLSHNLIHRDGLSVRAAQRVLAESYGLRRSIGSIMHDPRMWKCPRCPHVVELRRQGRAAAAGQKASSEKPQADASGSQPDEAAGAADWGIRPNLKRRLRP